MKWGLIWLVGLIMCGLTGMAYGASVQLGWNYEVDQEPHISGYEIHYGTASFGEVMEVSEAAYDQQVFVPDPSARSFVIEGLEHGTYYFRIASKLVVGDEVTYSLFSTTELVHALPLAEPTDFRIHGDD
jgi:hypothetical protein